ncbi:MAG: hypothetical protein AB198_00370 [Parcubacteria bacterium C7867-003]|nr:MAG: hypothetical protein AB198_00370 [Parcubacteria bacterium C7867-003]
METDPIKEIDRLLRELNDRAGSFTKPVLNRYPLLFAFLLTFSIAAILHGFELVTDEIGILRDNPFYLILLGCFLLFITGTLYKKLEKDIE